VVSVSVRPPVGLVIRMLPGQRAEDFTTHAPATVTPMRLPWIKLMYRCSCGPMIGMVQRRAE
jgi:hypothetical protein